MRRRRPHLLRPSLSLLFGQPLGQRVNLTRQLPRLRRERLGVLRRVRRRRRRAVPMRQISRLVAQRLHRPFERRPFEHIGAALKLIPHPLLLLRQVAERLSLLALLQRLGALIELVQLRLQFGRQRIMQHLLRLVQLPRQSRVQRPGLRKLTLELLGLLLQGLHPRGKLTLRVTELFGPFG